MAAAVETLSIPTGALAEKSGIKFRGKKTFYSSTVEQFYQ